MAVTEPLPASEPTGIARPDRRVARTHADIADAVRSLFVEEGWEAITHQRVAERARYGRNTVYRHFPDRTALLLHGGSFAEVHHAPITGDLRTDLIAELTAFRRELFDGIVGRIIAAMVDRAQRDPEIVQIREHLIAAGTAQTRGLVRQGVESGRMSSAIDTDQHVANLCGPLIYSRLCLDVMPTDAAIEHLVDTHLSNRDSTRPPDFVG